MKSPAFSMIFGLIVAACGQQPVNPPDRPAPPVQSPEVLREVEPPGPSSLANRGAKSFVGVWSVNALWCADPQGEQRPIRITPLRFEGYENNCDITRIVEITGGYDVDLACVAEGGERIERARLMVSGDLLTLIYLDRPGHDVKLGRCPRSAKPEEQAGDLMKMLKKGG